MEQDFRFLLIRHPDNGLVFVALDSVVGYIRYLSRELSTVAYQAEDPSITAGISKAFDLLSDRIEDIESGDTNSTEI